MRVTLSCSPLCDLVALYWKILVSLLLILSTTATISLPLYLRHWFALSFVSGLRPSAGTVLKLWTRVEEASPPPTPAAATTFVSIR
ncbi:hypothetical protein OSTOST_23460 [Ostertagia ostertagi]